MQAQSGAGEAMYGFVGCTVRWVMTGTVVPVNRQTTMRVLAVLFRSRARKALLSEENSAHRAALAGIADPSKWPS
jgi:hypothetical protein